MMSHTNYTFNVQLRTSEQMADLLVFFDPFNKLGNRPCWMGPCKWSPWPLSPDSDPQERWILVNAYNDAEEHPDGRLYATAQEALNAADRLNVGAP